MLISISLYKDYKEEPEPEPHLKFTAGAGAASFLAGSDSLV
jgi:hypothetical protein